MGFGTGLDTPARHLPIVAPEEASSLRVRPFLLKWAGVARTIVLTPADAPPPIQLSRLRTWADREAHARKLVTLRAVVDGMIYAERCVVGDARDLFCHVVEQTLGQRPVTANEGEPTPSSRYALVVHIGGTTAVETVLQGVLSSRRSGTLGRDHVDWDGRFETLDADGYIHLCVDISGQRHLYLCGGSEYGTYFAVSQFLREHVGAEWVHPGASGEVIPAAWGAIGTREPVNRFDEPDVRMRTFALVSPGGNAHTAPEKDEIRAWLLRNRVRPGAQLAEILEQVGLVPDLPANVACAQSSNRDAQALFQRLLGPESRSPIGHGMTRFLSPFDPPMILDGDGSPRFENGATRGIYPELRPRRTDALAPAESGLPPDLGEIDARLVLERVPLKAPEDQCLVPGSDRVLRSAYVPLVQRRGGGGYVIGTDEDLAQVLTGMPSLGGIASKLFTAAIRRIASSGRAYRRIIPAAQRLRIEAANWPQGTWHPCVFDHTERPVGSLHPVHDHLPIDIARQIHAIYGALYSIGHDEVANLAFDDADRWCTCDGCLRADSVGGPGDALLLWYGRVLHADRSSLCPFFLAPADRLGVRVSGTVWNDAGNPFRDMSRDELTARGILHDAGYHSWRSQRVLALVNSAARRLREDALGRTPSADDEYRWSQDRTVVFFAYGQCAAAPLWSPVERGVDRSLGETVDDLLTVCVATSRDTQEYNELYPREVSPGQIAGAYTRLLQWPQQFQHERWARIALRTVLYEYIVHDGFHVPRLYSRKLQRAVSTGVRQFNVKGFVSETNAAWGLGGPGLWELAEILWNGSRSGTGLDPDHDNTDEVVDALRMRYCERAFGAAAYAMKSYFDLCEAGWSSTRDGEVHYRSDAGVRSTQSAPDHRLQSASANGYFGQGYAGRQRVMSQFRGMYDLVPAPIAEFTVPGGGDALIPRHESLWRILELALRQVARGSAEWERVQLHRRCFGFARMIARWYRPLHDAFEAIRQKNTLPMYQSVPGVASLQSLFQDGNPESGTGAFRPLGSTQVASSDPLPSALVDAVIASIGDPTVRGATPGIRLLRRQVHRYLARQDLDENSSMGAGDLGFGFSDAMSAAMMTGEEAFSVPVSPLMTDQQARQRLAGPYWPDALQYMGWWDGVLRKTGGDPDLVTAAIVGLSYGEGGEVEWLFNEIKKMAKIVILYGASVVTAERTTARLLQFIRQG